MSLGFSVKSFRMQIIGDKFRDFIVICFNMEYNEWSYIFMGIRN